MRVLPRQDGDSNIILSDVRSSAARKPKRRRFGAPSWHRHRTHLRLGGELECEGLFSTLIGEWEAPASKNKPQGFI